MTETLLAAYHAPGETGRMPRRALVVRSTFASDMGTRFKVIVASSGAMFLCCTGNHPSERAAVEHAIAFVCGERSY